MASGDVCHGPRCSLAGLRPVALEYRSCHWPVGWLGRPSVSDPWGVGSFLSLGRPRCVRCPGPLGSRSPVCPLGVLHCVCGVLGHLAPVHQCARSVRCFACAVSLATWLLFTGVPAWFVASRLRCPGPLGSCSPVRPLGVLCCVWGVLGHLAPVHRCARSVCCFVCAVSRAIWLLFTGMPGCGVPSLCCPPCMCVWGVLAQVVPIHRCARSVRCACAVGGYVPLPPPLILFFPCLLVKVFSSRRASKLPKKESTHPTNLKNQNQPGQQQKAPFSAKNLKNRNLTTRSRPCIVFGSSFGF